MSTEEGSPFAPSVHRDLSGGLPTGVEHILGDRIARARQLAPTTPLLDRHPTSPRPSGPVHATAVSGATGTVGAPTPAAAQLEAAGGALDDTDDGLVDRHPDSADGAPGRPQKGPLRPTPAK